MILRVLGVCLAQVPIYAGLTYDAVMLWARAATQVLRENGSLSNGTAVGLKIRGSLYRSALGFDIRVDENGDAEGNYTVLGFSLPVDDHLTPVGRFTLAENASSLPVFRQEKPIAWLGGSPPVGEPKCGFKNDKCASKQDWRVLVICITCACVVLVLGVFAFRHYHYEYKLARLLWKVDMDEVMVLRTNSELSLQDGAQNGVLETTRLGFAFPDEQHLLKLRRRLQSAPWVGGWAANPAATTAAALDTAEATGTGTRRGRVGFYKGNVVHIKRVYKKNVDLTRSIRKELIQVREMRHENVTPFIGACVDPPNICVLTLFCARGSLEIADFGLHEFRAAQTCVPQKVSENAFRGLLWRAPELLRMASPPARGTQKGDVYSFGIVLYEIIGRHGPWGQKAPPTHGKSCSLDFYCETQEYTTIRIVF
ncbi:hypothetical protein HPB48_010444 [Haemaphysalis longicornis]|uniref:guanylate cyclase n=1 Tax=Haemaphysalis longicornis TaxID=44386 RepID=A0A9J6FRX0_HAELO|nr:hypothetical protein HPB48_010444 [Haemaphysalis longicornis]